MGIARLTLFSSAAVLSVALSGCSSAPNAVVSPTPTPTPTVTVTPPTPEQVWDDFMQISDASCQGFYTGLVEEEITGPNVGKLKIALTFEQAGENSMAYSLPSGETGALLWTDFLACESRIFIDQMESGGLYYSEIPGYSTDWPIQITFDQQTGNFTTSRLTESGNQRTLIFEVVAGLFTVVEDVENATRTTLTYGLPGPAETQIVNDFWTDYFSE